MPAYPAARSTPTVDGEVLYALGSDGDLVCLETATGKQLWHKNLQTDFGGKPGQWAYAESPLVDGDALVCTPGGASATLVKLNKKSGEVIWKSAVPGADEAGYASVTPIEVGGTKQYVQFLQKGLVGVDANTGKFLWRYEKTAKGSAANIPSPTAAGDYVYSGAGQSGAGLVKLVGASGSFKAQEVYFSPRLPTAIGGTVLLGDYLYGTNSSTLQCIDFKTGSPKWTNRSIGAASICAAEGCLYLHGENGEVALVQASPAAYKELGRFTPPNPPDRQMNGAKAWPYPVIANARLYIRDSSSIWCYDIKAP
jgi:outer membrane protein assembly factor BamB